MGHHGYEKALREQEEIILSCGSLEGSINNMITILRGTFEYRYEDQKRIS